MEHDIQIEGGETIVALRGRLNEHADLAPLAARLGGAGGRVILDLAGVQSTNSVGVKHWLGFIRALAGVSELVLRSCSPAVVLQLALIHGFAGRAVVESFQVTYACERCRLEKLALWRAGEQFSAGGWVSEPEVRCERCRAPLEMVDPRPLLGDLVMALGQATGR